MTKEFWLKVGDRVSHINDSSLIGTVTEIDENLIDFYGTTTCKVLWDDDGGEDIRWTNRLALLEDSFFDTIDDIRDY